MGDPHSEVAGAIEAILARYAQLKAATPELSGLAFAADHGWVSHDELAEAERAYDRIAAEYVELDRQLEASERAHPDGFRSYLEALRNQAAAGLEPAFADAVHALDHRLGRRPDPGHDLKWAMWIVRSARPKL